jgi:hypothetical protein
MVDPADYGLPKTTVLSEHDGGIALVVNRKSRIVMADGQRILTKVTKIRNKVAGVDIVLKTSAPVCTKTKTFLAEHGIAVLGYPS